MADRLKDAEDELLESLFAPEAIADDGFSDRVVGRIRRRLWVQRLSLPIAAIFGGMVAFRPASELVTTLSDLALRIVPTDAGFRLYEWLPPAHQIVAGALLLVVAMVSLRMLED